MWPNFMNYSGIFQMGLKKTMDNFNQDGVSLGSDYNLISVANTKFYRLNQLSYNLQVTGMHQTLIPTNLSIGPGSYILLKSLQ
jgi:hypothetical protein